MSKPPFLTRVRQTLARAIAPTQQRNGAFAGAAANRLNEWINAGRRSAAQDTYGDLVVLRTRARDLVRNTPFAARYVDLVADNIIGPHGIRLQSKASTLEGGKAHDRANAQIEAAWEAWSRPGACDVGGRYSLTELLTLAVKGRAMDGEMLLREIVGVGPFGYQLQLIDPDLLDETWNRAPAPDWNAVYQGVEVDQYFRPVAYWMWTKHPFDPAFDRQRIRIPASEIIHDFRAYRPGQVRGISDFAPIMGHLKMLDGYYEAEVVAARVASASMAVIEKTEYAPADDPTVGANDLPMEVEPAAMLRLNYGETMRAWEATHPTQAFESFTNKMELAIAAGLSVSYMSLTGDLKGTSYSSGRMGLIPERDRWRGDQQHLITHVLDRIYRNWLKYALLNQRTSGLQGLGYDSSRWTSIQWQPRGFVSVDPTKEIEAMLLERNAGVRSLTSWAAEQGRDLPDVIAEIAAEDKLFAAAGVSSNLATSITQKDSGTVEGEDGAPETASPSTGGGRVLPLRSGTHG